VSGSVLVEEGRRCLHLPGHSECCSAWDPEDRARQAFHSAVAVADPSCRDSDARRDPFAVDLDRDADASGAALEASQDVGSAVDEGSGDQEYVAVERAWDEWAGGHTSDAAAGDGEDLAVAAAAAAAAHPFPRPARDDACVGRDGPVAVRLAACPSPHLAGGGDSRQASFHWAHRGHCCHCSAEISCPFPDRRQQREREVAH
jgi:hypothetical protein